MVRIDLKIIISICYSKSVTHSVPSINRNKSRRSHKISMRNVLSTVTFEWRQTLEKLDFPFFDNVECSSLRRSNSDFIMIYYTSLACLCPILLYIIKWSVLNVRLDTINQSILSPLTYLGVCGFVSTNFRNKDGGSYSKVTITL